MKSKVLDTISVKEQYETTNGAKKTRTTTIKSMDNAGSQFVNIHSGRGSVCVSKAMVKKVAKALETVKWKNDEASEIEKLKAKIAKLEKKK